MATTFSLDLGTCSIKAVLFDQRRGRLRVEAAQRLDLPPSSDFGSWLAELSTALSELSLRVGNPELTAVVLPSHLAVFRTVQLPFTNLREVAQVIKGEVEPQLSVPIEDVVVDFQVLHQKDGQSEVLAAAVPKNHIRKILEVLQQVRIEPDLLTLDLFCQAALAPRCDAQMQFENALVLDLGAGATKAVLLQEAKLSAARVIQQGGNDLTKSIQEELGLDRNDAENLKTGEEDQTPRLREITAGFVSRLAREIHIFLASVGVERAIDSVLLTGGGAGLRGLAKSLGEALSAEVREEVGLDLLAISREAGDRSFQLSLFFSAAGAALPGQDPDLLLPNFLKEEFKSRPRFDSFVQPLAAGVTLVAIFIAVLAFDAYRKLGHLKDAVAGAHAEQERVWQEVFPGTPLPRTRAVLRMEDRLAQLQVKLKKLQDSPTQKSALRTLHDVLKLVPLDKDFILKNMSVTSSLVTVVGETDTWTSAQQIQAAINQSPRLTCLLNSADEKGGRILFRLEIHLTNNEPPVGRP